MSQPPNTRNKIPQLPSGLKQVIATNFYEDCEDLHEGAGEKRNKITQKSHEELVEKLMDLCYPAENLKAFLNCTKKNVKRVKKVCDVLHTDKIAEVRNILESQVLNYYDTNKLKEFFAFKKKVKQVIAILNGSDYASNTDPSERFGRLAGIDSRKNAKSTALKQISMAWNIPLQSVKKRYNESVFANDMFKNIQTKDLSCEIRFENSEAILRIIPEDEDSFTTEVELNRINFEPEFDQHLWPMRELRKLIFKLIMNLFVIDIDNGKRGVMHPEVTYYETIRSDSDEEDFNG